MNFVSTTAKAVGTAAIKHAIAHPYRTTIAAAGIGLGPFLGAGWMIAMPLNALGFGAGGVAGGMSTSLYTTSIAVANNFSSVQDRLRLGISRLFMELIFLLAVCLHCCNTLVPCCKTIRVEFIGTVEAGSPSWWNKLYP
jgi:hypothetical protein